MLKCRFWFSRYGLGLKTLHFYQLPGDTDIAVPKATLEVARSGGTLKNENTMQQKQSKKEPKCVIWILERKESKGSFHHRFF